jgi:hypothetical protein
MARSPYLGRQFTPSELHPQRPSSAASHAIETLVALVTAGELDSDLPLLYSTIGDLLQAIEAARFANALARLSIGDRVRIGHDVRPGYVHGPPATVIQRGTDTITIQLDRPVDKFGRSCTFVASGGASEQRWLEVAEAEHRQTDQRLRRVEAIGAG